MECSLLVPEWSGCLTLALFSRKLQRLLQTRGGIIIQIFHRSWLDCGYCDIIRDNFKQAQELDNRRAFNQGPLYRKELSAMIDEMITTHDCRPYPLESYI